MASYDGWAIGVYAYVSYRSNLDTLKEGFCLPDYSCVGVYLEYTNTPSYIFTPLTFLMSEAASATNPAFTAAMSTYE